MYDKILLDEIKAIFSQEKGQESCGLIVFNNNSFQFINCRNIAQDKINNFSIDPLDYLKASRLGTIHSCVHSHIKDLSFSIQDVNNSFNNNLNYLLYNVKRDKFYFFDVLKYKSYEKYLNLNFKLGENDCANLICNFYKQHLNIEIPNKPIIKDCHSYEELKNRNLHVWNKAMYLDNINIFDIFKPKNFEDLNLFDIIIFNHPKDNVPVHCALYIDNELILHQMENSISRIETMRKGHFKFINCAARYKRNF